MHRLLIVAAPFLMAILLYLGLSAVEQSEFQTSVAIESTLPQYEAYSEGLNSVLFNSDGSIDYTLQASRQVHYPNNHSEFENPWLRMYSTEHGNWNIVADSGTISGADSQGGNVEVIELSGNVEAYRLDSAGSRLQLNTDWLNINPTQETLYTDSQVNMVTDAITQSATGMRADMGREEIIFMRDVQGRYEIPAN
ncbi:MAG: LPS export ABC transporter periplasmic protein LptC [Gammaproteobacteria bacterium]